MIIAYSEELRNLIDRLRDTTSLLEAALGHQHQVDWDSAWESPACVFRTVRGLAGLGFHQAAAAMESEVSAIYVALDQAVLNYIKYTSASAPIRFPNAVYVGTWELHFIGEALKEVKTTVPEVPTLRVLSDPDHQRSLQPTTYPYLGGR